MMSSGSQPYAQFHNDMAEPTGAPPPPLCQQNHKADAVVAECYRRSRTLTLAQMTISCATLVLGLVTVCVAGAYSASIYDYNYSIHLPTTFFGAEIWVGALGVIGAGLGLGAIRYGNYQSTCLLIAHFVMCKINAIGSICLIGSASGYLGMVSNSLSYYFYRQQHPDNPYYDLPDAATTTTQAYPLEPVATARTLLVLQAFLLLLAIASLLANIISSAYICRYWCSRQSGEAAGTVLYVPTQVNGANGPLQAIVVPRGSQVVFLQTPSNIQLQTQTQPQPQPQPLTTLVAGPQTILA